jgi:hypothetical protein
MVHYFRAIAALIVISFGVIATYAQTEPEDSADTSAAQARIQAMQQSAPLSSQSQEAFPALKAQSCKAAVPYVESKLADDWDKTMKKYTADRKGLTTPRTNCCPMLIGEPAPLPRSRRTCTRFAS